MAQASKIEFQQGDAEVFEISKGSAKQACGFYLSSMKPGLGGKQKWPQNNQLVIKNDRTCQS